MDTPYVVVPPAGGPRSDAPVVIAYHLLDFPNNERAFAAAVPLDGLDAWKVYLGLPLSGARTPAGGLWPLLMDDAVLKVHQHVVFGALAELPEAFAAVKDRYGIADGTPLGVLGGSMGGAAAHLVIAESGLDIRAAVLINPVVQFRDSIDGIAAHHGGSYAWSPASDEVAARLDFVARAEDIGHAAIRYVVGADDMVDAILAPVDRVVARLPRADLRVVPDMAHAVADEDEAAPRTPQAKIVDGLAVDWFRKHLS